jgi:hypothetical protein
MLAEQRQAATTTSLENKGKIKGKKANSERMANN